MVGASDGVEETGGSLDTLEDSPPEETSGVGDTVGPVEGVGDTVGSAEGDGDTEGEGDTFLPEMWSEPPLQVPGTLSEAYQPLSVS